MYRVLWLLGVSVLALLTIGFLVLASAGTESGMRFYNDASVYVVKQGIWLALGLLGMSFAAFFDYHKWRELPWLTICGYVAIIVLMGVVLLLPATKGSHRWITLGPMRVQPSEFAKLFAVISCAVFLDRLGWKISLFWKGVFPVAMLIGLLMGLAVVEPDFGATAIIGATAGVLFLVSGVKYLHLIYLGLLGVVPVAVLLLKNKNRMDRIFSWMGGALSWLGGPFSQMAAESSAVGIDPKDYQPTHAIIAIKNGGLFGVGFNQSKEKLLYLPEAHTDYIFAVGAEEWGLFFSLILVALYLTVFVCGMVIAARSHDRLGKLLAYGMTFLVVSQAFFNLAVVTKCCPSKGIALPFISYGGTSLMSVLFAIGVLMNVGRQISLPKMRPRRTILPVFQTQGV